MNVPQISESEFPVFVVTSSQRKFDHLLNLSGLMDLSDKHNVSLYRLNWEYEEIQTDNMEYMLSDAVDREIFDNIRNSFFIIEQTSVYFDVKDGKEPGYNFKKWWNTKMDDELQIMFSRDPGATIESGLALNIPGHEPMIFVNKQRGKIDLDGNIREENKEYSWLSANDFNLYFIPQGATKVYTAMELSEFYKYDFRKPNFEKIAERLGEYSSILSQMITMDTLHQAFREYYDPSVEQEYRPEQTVSPNQATLDGDFRGSE